MRSAGALKESISTPSVANTPKINTDNTGVNLKKKKKIRLQLSAVFNLEAPPLTLTQHDLSAAHSQNTLCVIKDRSNVTIKKELGHSSVSYP